MKLLNGLDVASYIKNRQLADSRALRQAHGVTPKLAIIRTNPDPIVDSYMKLKQSYGDEIAVDVEVHTIKQDDAIKTIEMLNKDKDVHGIIVQIPLPDPSQSDVILNTVKPNKDVDGLSDDSVFDAPTPIAITWLLAAYNVDLKDKKILIIGRGRLVGKPLEKLWKTTNLDVTVATKATKELGDLTANADVIVSATGVPRLITQSMIKPNAVIVDAGVATDKNGLIGDVADDVRLMSDIKITPEKGGVGPLTICALFDNVLRSARSSISGKL
ncbi:MAG: bifunctional 5,10-methylenetetrahydrofolate dehydrogenase/5,10-methenyltetrahydrofolate cyclohydrolase [Candidatus Saccharibacteria bacterium]|nr:bifunctional 5,10-methylenetetrahydrofolate dehydrogenase/5,10-methenyltetrahydrofolate cyclohydrolase [Candidatus Saccharibacteria bacterium]